MLRRSLGDGWTRAGERPASPGMEGKRMVKKRPRIEYTDDFQEILPWCYTLSGYGCGTLSTGG